MSSIVPEAFWGVLVCVSVAYPLVRDEEGFKSEEERTRGRTRYMVDRRNGRGLTVSRISNSPEGQLIPMAAAHVRQKYQPADFDHSQLLNIQYRRTDCVPKQRCR